MSEKRPSKSEVPASEKAVEFQLPAGWKRDEVQGLRGISLPRTRYIGPRGEIANSKRALQQFLQEIIDIRALHFRSGLKIPSQAQSTRPTKRHPAKSGSSKSFKCDHSKMFEYSGPPPVRRILLLPKATCAAVSTCPESKRMEVLPRRQDVDYSSARMRNTRPPVQLFWEKRITQLLSQVPPGARGEQLLRSLKLPQCLAERLADPQSPFSSMALDQLTVLQSIIAAIQGLHAASSSSFSSTANAGGAPMSSRSQQHGAAAATSASGNAEQDANCKSDAAPAAQVAIGQQLSADAPGASTRDQSTAAGRPRFHFEYAKQTHHSSNIEYRDIRQPLCPSFTVLRCHQFHYDSPYFHTHARAVDEKTTTSVLREESEACARVTALRRVLAGALSALDASPRAGPENGPVEIPTSTTHADTSAVSTSAATLVSAAPLTSDAVPNADASDVATSAGVTAAPSASNAPHADANSVDSTAAVATSALSTSNVPIVSVAPSACIAAPLVPSAGTSASETSAGVSSEAPVEPGAAAPQPQPQPQPEASSPPAKRVRIELQ